MQERVDLGKWWALSLIGADLEQAPSHIINAMDLRTDNVCTLVSKIACTNMSPKNNKKRNYNHNGGDVSPNKPMRMWV